MLTFVKKMLNEKGLIASSRDKNVWSEDFDSIQFRKNKFGKKDTEKRVN